MQSTTVTPTAVNWNSSPAFTWGQEDAVAGVDRRGSVYFHMGSQDYADYNAGYDSGLRARQQSQALATAAEAAPANRAGRAMQLVASGAVVKNGHGCHVHSQSGSEIYHTTVDHCTCPDHVYRHNECKHMLAVRMTENMSEHDFLSSALESLRTGQVQPYVLSDEELARFDSEPLHTDWRG